MESWTRAIVEWVNCLGIAQSTIEDLQDLKNDAFYGKLVVKLSRRNEQASTNASHDVAAAASTTSIDERELVSKFIQGEYPEFTSDSDRDADIIPDELYTASLLLALCSQNGAFHRPMCSNLKNETQIHIKKFLELVLPYGRSLSREALATAIMEVGDATPNTPPATPKPSRPLREFFNSPAARSAQSQRFNNDRNREIRRLRAQLETEIFEKADLMEDMKIQEERIENLQKKLETKCQELRALRNERLKPPTPQSCRKNKRPSDTEERYKRELEEFESANAALRAEIDDLRDERDQLARRIISKDRVNVAVKKKLDETERSLETLALQIESKNNELLDMRMNNEQLREHIREIQRSSLGEQSFEMESVGRVRSPTFFNSSEALSSIVDIQLQEAREESAQLRIQLESINQRSEATKRVFEEMKLVNGVLREKAEKYTETVNRNQALQSELSKAEATIREIEYKLRHMSGELSNVEKERNESLLAKDKIERYARDADEKILTLEAKISHSVVRIEELELLASREMETSKTLREELANMSSTIDTLTRHLDESANRENAAAARAKAAEEKVAELTELAKEAENIRLEHEREFEERIASYERSAANTKQRMDQLDIELEESLKNLQRQTATNAALKETEIQLTKTKCELEDKLTGEQNRMALVLAENDGLKKELALSIESSAKTEKRVKNIEQELDRCKKELEKQMNNNATLEKDRGELNALRFDLEKNLETERQKLVTIGKEKDALNGELSAHVRSVAELRERIEIMEKNLEKSQENYQGQLAANELLRDERRERKERITELETQLSRKQEELAAIESEKETLKEEAVSCVSALKSQLAESDKKLQEQLDAVVALENGKIGMNAIRSDLESELELQRQELVGIKKEKDAINEELSSRVRSAVKSKERIEEIERNLEESRENLQEQLAVNARLRDEQRAREKQIADLEKELSRKREELAAMESEKAESKDEAFSCISLLKSQLDEYKKRDEKSKETLRISEAERSRLANDLTIVRNERASLEKRIDEISEESDRRREDLLGSTNAQLNELKRERDRLAENLKERIDSSNDLVASLEKRLLSAEKACAEAKLEEKLKEEAVVLVRGKLEQLTKEKIESELRMKEVILNMQEVRKSQDDVLEAQAEALKDKSCQLDEAEKELAGARAMLVEKSSDLEKSAKLAEALRETLEIERTKVKESFDRCEASRNDITRVASDLKFQLDGLRQTVERTCPKLARPNERISCTEGGSIDDADNTDICRVIESFADEARTIARAVSILGEANETLKIHLDNEKRTTASSRSEAEERKLQLDERTATMEKRDRCLSLLARRQGDLKELVSTVVAKRNEVDEKVGALAKRWRHIADEARSLLIDESSSCDEVKHLRIKRTELDEILANIGERHACGSKPLLQSLCRIFVWSETKMRQVELVDAAGEDEFFALHELSDEEEFLKVEMGNNDKVRETLEAVGEKIDRFSVDLKSYETGLKAGAIKREASNEEKLRAQLEKMTKERKEMKDKLDAMRTRNAKLEKNMDDLRNENKKLKRPESADSTNVTEIERLEKLTEKLTKEILTLQRDNEELSKKKTSEPNDEARLKEVHHEYGLKLEKIKQKMKTAYNEQIAKLNEEQEKIMKNKIEALREQMEQQCRKYTEDIAKYKAHISDLSSRYWDVGEKLLAETQEKQAALVQLEQFKGQQQQRAAIIETKQQTAFAQSRQKTASLDRRDFGADRTTRESAATRPSYRTVEMIEEETTTYSTRRRSVQSIQAMGNAFNAEDEEGEVFDSVYLADLKEGRCAAALAPDFDRISELRTRNSMCRPHLRSSYAVETHVQPITLSEDDIKNGATGDDVFNDSLSQSLLPGQKPKKKDRTQTSYKRPGPPTPSKNGGRLSLQGNEPKSPTRGILREKNVDRRATATPRGLKNLFGTSISRRQDENSTSTPKGRRLSNIFRKQRTERN